MGLRVCLAVVIVSCVVLVNWASPVHAQGKRDGIPATKKRTVTDDYHGIKVSEDFREHFRTVRAVCGVYPLRLSGSQSESFRVYR